MSETPRKDAIQDYLFKINSNDCSRVERAAVVRLLTECQFPLNPPLPSSVNFRSRQGDAIAAANAGKCVEHAEAVMRFTDDELLQYCKARNLQALLQRILVVFDEPVDGGAFLPIE